MNIEIFARFIIDPSTGGGAAALALTAYTLDEQLESANMAVIRLIVVHQFSKIHNIPFEPVDLPVAREYVFNWVDFSEGGYL
ncbi:MAG: hypothetical protein HUK20_11730 [Fibrobacter sp.]|nr:hypothetical protein [Fibrobacter sp.]